MLNNNLPMIPKQPFMVELSSSYYKYVVNSFGISHFYSFFVQDNNKIKISVPDGCIDIMIHYSPDRSEFGADFYGTDLLPHSMKVYSGCTHFGVRFLPGFRPPISNVAMPEMLDRIIPFDEISDFRHLPELIAANDNFIKQIDIFMKVYMNMYDSAELQKNTVKDGLIYEIIRSYGNITVDELSKKTNYSTSYIDKIFHKEIGMSPKKFCNILRFQWTLNCINLNVEEDMNYDDIIYKFGYYDQSHFIKEFKKYSKHTPTKYIGNLKNADYYNKLIVLQKDSNIIY